MLELDLLSVVVYNFNKDDVIISVMYVLFVFGVFRFYFVIIEVIFQPFDFVCVSDPFELFLDGVNVGIPPDFFFFALGVIVDLSVNKLLTLNRLWGLHIVEILSKRAIFVHDYWCSEELFVVRSRCTSLMLLGFYQTLS